MNNQLVVLNTRIVTVYSTVGNNKNDVKTNASDWGGLKRDLSEAGISFNNMNVVVGETQVSLVSNEAQLPNDNFTIFLLPVKVKSGYTVLSDDDYDDDDDSKDDDDDDNDDDVVDDDNNSDDAIIADLQSIKQMCDTVITKVRSKSGPIKSDDPVINALSSKANDIIRNMQG